jgi:CheY-like chemotaxis protein
MLAMLLRGRNIQCDIADNGLEALNMVKANGNIYDLIFMDFTMPVMVREAMINTVLRG